MPCPWPGRSIIEMPLTLPAPCWQWSLLCLVDLHRFWALPGSQPVPLSQNHFNFSLMFPHPCSAGGSAASLPHVHNSSKEGSPPESLGCSYSVLHLLHQHTMRPEEEKKKKNGKKKATTTAFKLHLNCSSAISLHATITYAKQPPAFTAPPL